MEQIAVVLKQVDVGLRTVELAWNVARTFVGRCSIGASLVSIS